MLNFIEKNFVHLELLMLVFYPLVFTLVKLYKAHHPPSMSNVWGSYLIFFFIVYYFLQPHKAFTTILLKLQSEFTSSKLFRHTINYTWTLVSYIFCHIFSSLKKTPVMYRYYKVLQCGWACGIRCAHYLVHKPDVFGFETAKELQSFCKRNRSAPSFGELQDVLKDRTNPLCP